MRGHIASARYLYTIFEVEISLGNIIYRIGYTDFILELIIVVSRALKLSFLIG